MREAARLTSTFISGARSRAIQTGREVGVVIQRFNGNPYAMALAYVEVPPAYGGDVTGATCKARQVGMPIDPQSDVYGGGAAVAKQWLRVEFAPGVANALMIRIRDEIQFNYQGHRYRILGPDANVDGAIDLPASGNPLILDVAYLREPNEPLVRLPYESETPGLAFQVFRQPMRSSDTPMQLPEGVVIDLLYSGVGLGAAGLFIDPASVPAPPWPSTWPGTWQTNPPAPFDPIITFTPNGAVGHVTLSATGGGPVTFARPSGQIFLLLGRRDLMPDVTLIRGTTTPEDKNIYDADAAPANAYLENFWITIGYQTGLVAVTENARNLGPTNANYLIDARTFALSSQSVGGK
jgi:hypothetical protein